VRFSLQWLELIEIKLGSVMDTSRKDGICGN